LHPLSGRYRGVRAGGMDVRAAAQARAESGLFSSRAALSRRRRGDDRRQRGELDLAGIPPAEYERVRADARYQPLLLSRTTLRTQYLGLNCALWPFDHVAVRQAMNLAIDKQRLIDL